MDRHWVIHAELGARSTRDISPKTTLLGAPPKRELDCQETVVCWESEETVKISRQQCGLAYAGHAAELAADGVG